jgi:deazaflavin-dependent oxidoreductase (nitroreductase family)
VTSRPGPAAWAEKHLANPPLRALLRLGLAPRAFALLETTGRRTGRRRLTPVGNGLDGDVFWLIAARGHRCSYVANLTTSPRCRVKAGRRWHAGTAAFLQDDDPLGRRAGLDQANGIIGRLDGLAFRATATRPVTIRIDLDSSQLEHRPQPQHR